MFFTLVLQTTPNHVNVATPLWGKCEDETRTPKKWELGVLWDSRKLRVRLQGSKHLALRCFWFIGEVLKRRCRKWPRMCHFDICSTSYGRLPTIKSQESTRPRCVQVECDTTLESSWGELQVCFRPRLNRRSERGVMSSQSPGSLNQDNFGTPPWESRD
jgi:hypothetical protein